MKKIFFNWFSIRITSVVKLLVMVWAMGGNIEVKIRYYTNNKSS